MSARCRASTRTCTCSRSPWPNAPFPPVGAVVGRDDECVRPSRDSAHRLVHRFGVSAGMRHSSLSRSPTSSGSEGSVPRNSGCPERPLARLGPAARRRSRSPSLPNADPPDDPHVAVNVGRRHPTAVIRARHRAGGVPRTVGRHRSPGWARHICHPVPSPPRRPAEAEHSAGVTSGPPRPEVGRRR